MPDLRAPGKGVDWGMESEMGFHEMKALLEWQLEMGASEAICDAPIDRYALAEKAPKIAKAKPTKAVNAPIPEPVIDTQAVAKQAFSDVPDLPALRQTLHDFAHCDLKKGARNTVFSAGNPGADVMIIGEAPSRDEDRQGAPFVGAEGALLDKMFAAIGLSRDALYLTNASPWRAQQTGDLAAKDIEMITPYLTRHIELISPKILILMGNTPCQILLKQRGVTRIRGQWGQVSDVATMPMFHPAFLLRNPAAKREAWADLLEIKAKLENL